MSIIATQSINYEYIKARWQELYTSSAINKRFFGAQPKGVYAGFLISPNGLFSGRGVSITGGSVSGGLGSGLNGPGYVSGHYDETVGYSIALHQNNSGWSTMVQIPPTQAAYQFNLTGQEGNRVFLAMDVNYTPNQQTTANFYALLASDILNNPSVIVLGYVDVPVSPSTPLDSSMVGYFDPTYPRITPFASTFNGGFMSPAHVQQLNNNVVNPWTKLCQTSLNQSEPHTVEITPSQTVVNNKRAYTYISAGTSSKFPRSSSGAYNGGALNDQLTYLNFQTGSITGAHAVSGNTSFSIATVSGVPNSFQAATIAIDQDDFLSVTYGAVYSSSVSALADDNLPQPDSATMQIALILLSTDGSGVIQNLNTNSISDRRPMLNVGGGAGGGSGSGSKNYVPDPDFQNTPSGFPSKYWSAFNTSLDSNFHPTGVPTFTSSVVSQLVLDAAALTNSKGLRLATSSVSVSGHGIISVPMTLDKAALAKQMIASLSYLINPTDDVGSLSGEISGSTRQTIGVYFYDESNPGNWIVPENFNGINTKGSVSDLVGDLVCSFPSSITPGQQYRIAIVFRNDLPDSSVRIDFDNFVLSKDEKTQGSRLLAAYAIATIGGQAISPSQPINFDTVTYDYGNAITTGSSWKYSAQEAGVYSISFYGAGSPVAGCSLYKNGSFYGSIGVFKSGADCTGAIDVYLNPNEYIDIRADGSGTNTSGTQRIAIHQVGKIQESSSGRPITCFAYMSASSFNGGAGSKVPLDLIYYDTAGAFDTANNEFVVPETGYYDIHIFSENGSPTTPGSSYLMVDGVIPSTPVPFRYAGDTYQPAFMFRNGSTTQDFFKAGQRIAMGVAGICTNNSYMIVTKIQGGSGAGSLGEPVNARYGLNATIGIPASTSTTVLFDTKDYDSHNVFDVSTGNYKAPVTGKYSISVSMFTANINSGTTLEVYGIVNGTIVSLASFKNLSASANAVQAVLVDDLKLNAGDLFRVDVFTGSAGGMNIGGDIRQARFSICKTG